MTAKSVGALCLAIGLATSAAAEQTCTLRPHPCAGNCDTISVRFAIDPNQFVDAQDAGDPPRRQITQVTLDGATFMAEALMFPGGVTGFHEGTGDLARRLMIVQPDGAARLVVDPPTRVWTGTCRSH